jgi:hypothetical protein
MAKQPTQTECREMYKKLVSETLGRIQEIDASTPASPVEEPSWWVEMLQLERTLRNLEIRK